MPGLSPLEFAALLAKMPQDMAAEAALTAKAAGGAAAEAVEIFEAASPEAVTLAEEALAVAATALPGRWWVWLIKIAGLIGLESLVEKVMSKGFSGGLALAVGHWPNMAAEVLKKVYDGLDTYTPIGSQVMAVVYDRVFSGAVSQQAVLDAMLTKPGPAQAGGAEVDTFGLLGSAFNDVFDQMFDIQGVAEDFKGRTTSFGSHKNFRRVMGANLSVGIHAQTMAIVSQLFPLGPLQHLTHLHQHLIVSMGLNRLSHTMLAVNVQHLIHRGVERDLLRNLKPFDLTQQRAIQAYLTGLIDRTTLNTIFDNEGLRDDVRDAEIALQEKDLSDSQLETLWQEQLVDEAYLTKSMRLKSFGAERAAKAVTLLKDKRLRELRDRNVQTNLHLYRDCVITDQELRTVLLDAHYTEEEIQQATTNAVTERRMRTFLPTTDMFKAVSEGLLDVGDAVNALQCRGYTYDDAIVEAIIRMEKYLPPCDDVKLQQKGLIELLQAFGSAAGISGKLLRPNVLKYLQCLDYTKFLIPPTAILTATPTNLPAPGNVTFKWQAILATSAKIEPSIGVVPLIGETTIHVAHSQGFEITASSPIGKGYASVFINIKPK